MPDITRLVQAGIDYLGDTPEDLADHYTWMLKELLNRLGPADLTTPEKMALVSVMVPAHSRKLHAACGTQPTPDVGLPRPLRLVAPLSSVSEPPTSGSKAN